MRSTGTVDEARPGSIRISNPRAGRSPSAARAVSILRHRMPRPADSHSGVSRSANQPSAIYTVLDAIQHCLDFMRTGRSVEQVNWNLSAQCAVRCGEPMRCLPRVAQSVDRLRQGARGSDHDLRLLRRQTRRRYVQLCIARVPPIRRVTERADQGSQRSHRTQVNRFYSKPARFPLGIGAPDRCNQLNGCLRGQPFASRASEV
ncbi:hypothetical protein SBA6_320025 [Candidatus Sulfopaludibacter sp. SbA6]|nr:hypothetical protein SBA6_320025 [Candidatus Sulfopaludibacter sp. SbA6]